MKASACVWLFVVVLGVGAWAQPGGEAPSSLREAIDGAVQTVKPALVRIHVVETYYREGREMKFEASGSGVVISAEGHVITNHHVAGHAKQIKCVFADKEELEAERVGTDPLTDICILKLKCEDGRSFPVVSFGDSEAVRVGDHVLAMGSPLALSQSVTLGIVCNTEMMMPDWMSRHGGLEQDGEDVGALVRWLGHDAQIFGGNSGGPLVNLKGDIIGINEIKMGLGGAIPGNLAKRVSEELIARGSVKRAWLGLEVQPRFKHDPDERGVLVSGTIKGSPATEAGLQAGDRLLSVNGTPIDVEFTVQLPDFNLLVSELPVGEAAQVVIERAGKEETLAITPIEREKYEPKQYEFKQWGLTVRDLSFMMAKEMKRDTADGVMVTSVRSGGPTGDAKPVIKPKDILLEVDGKPIRNVSELRAVTNTITEGAEDPVPTLTAFERKTEKYLTVVKVGIKELQDPGLEVKKAWLSVETQVITRDIAELLGAKDLTGFRITHVFRESTAEKAGLQVGDLILALDGEKMTASAPEHYEELDALVRQYRAGTTAELTVRRGGEELAIPVELVRATKLKREMKKYRDDNFEYTVRDISFFDKAEEEWEQEQRGVMVDEVKSGGWGALGRLAVADLILEVDGTPVPDIEAMKEAMDAVDRDHPDAVVFKVLRGIHTFYLELEPKWELK